MRIDLLQPGDEDRLIEVARIFNDEEMAQEQASRLLSDPDFVMVVARDDAGTLMGRIYGCVLHRLSQNDLFIYEVDVSPEHQRKGAARAMLAALGSLCATWGYGEMFVLTEAGNEAANALYRNAGGVLEGSPANMYVYFTPQK